jgi:hypothetical protein
MSYEKEPLGQRGFKLDLLARILIIRAKYQNYISGFESKARL